MPEFLPLGKNWLNVDKILQVDNNGTPSEPNLYVHLAGGERLGLIGEEAKILKRYLDGTPARIKN
jgi:hypothetical protein